MEIAHFSGREILEIAVQIEKNGVEFYTTAIKASKSARIKDLFTFLVGEENKHIKTFEKMMSGLKDERPSEKYDPYQEDEIKYMKALADSRVFIMPAEGGKLMLDVRGAGDVLVVAMDLERDSILFYNEMLRVVKEQDTHIIEDIISEEKRHFVKLQALHKELTGR